MRQTEPLPHIGLGGPRASMYEQAPQSIRVRLFEIDLADHKPREPIRVTAEVGEPIRELEGGEPDVCLRNSDPTATAPTATAD